MNLTNRNIFLSIVLIFISAMSHCTVQADFLDHKSIELEELHLYKIIIGIKAICLSERIEAIQQQENSPKDFDVAAQSPLKLIELALQEMKEIVIGLNKGVLLGNIEIEYKFVNLCTFLQNKKITPQALRELRKRISEFDCDLKQFCKKKKHYLTAGAFEHVNKMIRFNHMLIQGVLNDNYFDISMADLALDLIFHRPLEFARNHKLLIGGTVLVACGVITAIYGYPAYISYQLTNRNPRYPEMHQLHGFTQPARSGDCGYYAAVHTLLMMNAGLNADPAAMQEHLNRIPSINGVVARLKTINGGADWIDGDQVVRVLNQNIVQRCAADFQTIGLLPQNLDFQDIHMIENVGFLRNGQGIQQPLINAITRFRENNRPQGIVLLLAGNGANQHGHWVSLRLQRNAAGVLQPILINSQIRNITDYQIINQVIQLFADQPIQSQYGLEYISPPLDNATGVLDNDEHDGTELDRYQAAARHLALAIQRIQGAGNQQQVQELAFYRERITELFTRIRTDALRLGIHQVNLLNQVQNLDFDQVQNIDQLIVVLVGHPIA